MSVDNVFTFCCALLVWASIPGPAIFAIIANSLTAGVRSSVYLIAGILSGDVFYMGLVLVGMSAMGKLLGGIFIIIRIAGAIYLIYLGMRLWLRQPEPSGAMARHQGAERFKTFLSGISITLGNPKAILFHLGFLPTFFDLSRVGLSDALVIILVFLAVLGTCLMGYASAAARARYFFQDPAKIRLMNRGAGSLLVGTGIVLLAKE